MHVLNWQDVKEFFSQFLRNKIRSKQCKTEFYLIKGYDDMAWIMLDWQDVKDSRRNILHILLITSSIFGVRTISLFRFPENSYKAKTILYSFKRKLFRHKLEI